MPGYLKTRWELLLVIAVFIAVKIPALLYLFYWDESWSYAPAVKLMYLHGPSLMPNAIDLFYSRGHPLFFYAATAAWMRVFGPSVISQHSFCLALSVAVIVTCFEVCCRLFGRRAARMVLVALPLQVMFFVQSTFVLPEVMIALLCLLSLYWYSSGRYVLTFAGLTALMLTKESGLVMGLALGLHATVNLLNRREEWRSRLRGFLAVLFSGVATGIFFLLQKKINGWYLYPEHTGYIQWVWHIFWDKLRFALDVLFDFNNRVRIFQLLLLLGVVTAVHLRDVWYAVPLLPAYLINVIIEDKFTWLPRQVLFVIFLASLAITAYYLARLAVNRVQAANRFVLLGVFFIILYLCFTCINFFTARYLMCALVILFVIAAGYFEVYFAALYDTIFYLSLACCIVAGIYGFKYDSGLGDLNLGAFDGMKVEEREVSYLEAHRLFDAAISASNFQTREHLTKPFTGFLHTPQVFAHTMYDTSGAGYIVIDNIEPDPRFDAVKTSSNYRLVYHTASGAAWAEIYQRVQ